MINQIQENEQLYENLVQHEKDLKKSKEILYVTQNAKRTKLQKNINESKSQVKLSNKTISEGVFLHEKSNDASHASRKVKGADPGRTPVDVEKMLRDLRNVIVGIY